jgi:Polyketide cyclase / dehydrase and lipid transport
MLTYIVIAVVVVILVLLAIVAMQSSDFRVERKATIPASPAEVFAQVHDLHKWQAWSPWERVDPEMKRTYSGPAAGTGASYAWLGNRNVGEGRMTIAECRPNDLIRIKLEFFKPFKATNTAEFTFVPQGNSQTAVTWSMFGPKNFFAKALHMFCSMDKMIGGEFDKGLANLKAVVESAKQR